ncbi:MAG: hypothetical protein QM736_09920 [Vicinamibacterales bacterium]
MSVELTHLPLRDELLSTERVEERARSLATRLAIVETPGHGRHVLRRFRSNVRALSDAYKLLSSDARVGSYVTPAAEWLLDHYPLIAAEIRNIGRNLPKAFYKTLPCVVTQDGESYPRVYAMALELIRHSDSRFDRSALLRFMDSYQSVSPLSIGELWAWPSVLELALIESLRRLSDEILRARASREAADRAVHAFDPKRRELPTFASPLEPAFMAQLLHRAREYGLTFSTLQAAATSHLESNGLSPEDIVRIEHQRQAATQVSVENAVTSLRLCASLDWSEYLEAVSLVERVLRRDPAGVYPAMDFLSRDRQRQAVEEMSARTGEAQIATAEGAIEAAQAVAAQVSPAARGAHVGYHLIDDGRPVLERRLGLPVPFGRRVRRTFLGHPTVLYLGSMALVTAAITTLVLLFVARHGAGRSLLVVAGLLILVLASEIATHVIQRLAAALLRPERLQRLALEDGVPAHATTMVIVPTLLTSVAEIGQLCERLEVAAYGNTDPHVHFAILSDFADAKTPDVPGDMELLDAAREGIHDLNARFAGPGSPRFFLFHRSRQWNPREEVWMGWERKRGKIEEFNRLLRGATDTSFSVREGDLDLLPQVRYCLTLDSDTRLPRNAAKRLIGIITHPLNRAELDPRSGRVVKGYGILQPRVSVTLSSALGSLFARIYAGHTGVDPYTTAVSDLYQDLFGEGIFTGKGLYDVDAFTAALEDRVPENSVLSHDLFEGLFARTALVSDVEVVDDYPSSVLTHTRRLHRWVRGDWQICSGCFRSCRHATARSPTACR